MHIERYQECCREQIVEVWERSVRATHHFVREEDLQQFRQLVNALAFPAYNVYCMMDGAAVAGFIGTSESVIEMLFLDPPYMGKGLGAQLTRFALKVEGARFVEVNEQNEAAVRFYQRMGFSPYERTPTDGHGKDYPIIKMMLQP